MRSGKSVLVDHDQIADLHESPLQIPVHVPTDLPHARVTAAGIHSWHQPGVTGQMCGRRKPIYFADFQHQNHAQDRTHTRQRLQQIRFHAHLHNRFQPMLGRFDLGFQKIQRRQFLLDRRPAMHWQFGQPRAELQTSGDAKQIRSRHLHVVAGESAVDAVLHPRAQPHQENPEAQQLALIA